jgi:hypothetical protein
MNKKIIAVVTVLVLLVLLYAGYNAFLAPKGTEGAKAVTVQVVAEEQGIDKKFTFHTDQEFLTDLLKDKQDELGASIESSDLGTMISGIAGYKADAAKNEFFLIQVNGKDAATGTDDIAIQDGDVYKFVLSKF